ncbi:MAG: hypothetical protein RMY34_07070 [Aulosira sp. DedQUE10]|nr:hypothetical protein [Aulosira sp. DedQUE10]
MGINPSVFVICHLSPSSPSSPVPNAPIMVNIVEYTDVKLFLIKNERRDRISKICHIGTFFRIFDDLLGFMNTLYPCWRKPVF